MNERQVKALQAVLDAQKAFIVARKAAAEAGGPLRAVIETLQRRDVALNEFYDAFGGVRP